MPVVGDYRYKNEQYPNLDDEGKVFNPTNENDTSFFEDHLVDVVTRRFDVIGHLHVLVLIGVQIFALTASGFIKYVPMAFQTELVIARFIFRNPIE